MLDRNLFEHYIYASLSYLSSSVEWLMNTELAPVIKVKSVGGAMLKPPKEYNLPRDNSSL